MFLPRSVFGRANLGRALALAGKTTGLATGGCEPTHLPMLVSGLADPVDPWVVSYGRVVRVNHDHLIPLVHRILAHPVRV